MIRRLAQLFSITTVAVLLAFVIGAARPGPHRILCPECFDLTQISPRVWTDQPSQASALLAMVQRAEVTVENFFGGQALRPNLVLCSTRTCAQDFGIGGNGLSIAHVAVMVSPGGLTVGTLTHELTHFRLHRSLGPRNIIRQPFPTWFDEGLATHVADHPRWRGEITSAARTRVREVDKFWKWDDAYRALGVGRAYRAAAAEVAEFEQQAGRAGLRELITRAENGEAFQRVWQEISQR